MNYTVKIFSFNLFWICRVVFFFMSRPKKAENSGPSNWDKSRSTAQGVFLHSVINVSSVTVHRQRWVAFFPFCFGCKLNSEPEICLRKRVSRVEPPETRVCTKPYSKAHQQLRVCHPVKRKTGNEATKFLNPLKYKTPDILKMLAAKNDFTAVLICYFFFSLFFF